MPPRAENARPRHPLRALLVENNVYGLLVAIVVLATLTSGDFLRIDNFINILDRISITGYMALGMTMLLVGGFFDLSVGSTFAAAGMLSIILLPFGILPAFLIALAFGLVVGLTNGIFIIKLKVNSLIFTLGMQIVIYALALMLGYARSYIGYNDSFNLIARGRIGNIPYIVVLFALVTVAAELFVRNSRFGKSIYLLGSSYQAAKFSGLKVDMYLIALYAVMSALAAFSGVLMASKLNKMYSTSGVGLEFAAVIAALLGGTSILGGKGSILKTFFALLILSILNNLLALLNQPWYFQQIVNGAIFIGVISFDSVVNTRLRGA